LPPVATKLTQSPWFLKTPKSRQPPFLHCSFEVGKGGASRTTMSPLVTCDEEKGGGGCEQSVGTMLGPLNEVGTASKVSSPEPAGPPSTTVKKKPSKLKPPVC
jgi:hypothetical protein